MPSNHRCGAIAGAGVTSAGTEERMAEKGWADVQYSRKLKVPSESHVVKKFPRFPNDDVY